MSDEYTVEESLNWFKTLPGPLVEVILKHIAQLEASEAILAEAKADSKRRNEELWEYIKVRCGDERFFLQLSRSGDPREYANECLQEALETAQDLTTGPPIPGPL